MPYENIENSQMKHLFFINRYLSNYTAKLFYMLPYYNPDFRFNLIIIIKVYANYFSYKQRTL